MNKEERENLKLEIENVKKALRSVNYQHGYWQMMEATTRKQEALQQLANVTETLNSTEKYLAYLEELLAKG
jgi:hypothetical protein